MCTRHAQRVAYLLSIESLSTNYLTLTGVTESFRDLQKGECLNTAARVLLFAAAPG